MNFRLQCSLFAIVFCLIPFGQCEFGLSQQPSGQGAQDAGDLLYLRTERIPYKHRVDKGYQFLMMRELARQGLLVTANLDYGLTIRDETLGESLPADAQAVQLALTERADADGNWQLKLFRVEEQGGTAVPIDELWQQTPLWQSTLQYETSVREMYAFAASIFDCASFDEFSAALKTVGFVANPLEQAVDESADKLPTQRWEKELLQVDYVTQYGIVREVHQAIERDGESPELLATLSQAYANLALLTDHHSTAACRAFAARALILSARASRKFANTDASRLAQIYVWAVVGQHHTAAQIENYLSKPLVEFSDSHPWAEFIHAYLQSNLADLKRLRDVNSEIQPWAARLWTEMIKAYRYEQWLQEAMHLIPRITPTAYGAYAFLATRGGSLGVTRWAASAGPSEFAKHLPRSVRPLDGLPETVIAQLANSRGGGFLGFFSGNNELFSAVPSKIATALRDASNSDSLKAISWSALGSLIEEEQFVQASNFLKVSTNAVESSLDDEVDAALKYNFGHRYAHWLRSYYHLHQSALKERLLLQYELDLIDPRGNMVDMLADANYATRQLTPTEYVFDSWALPQADFTLQGIVDSSIMGGWTRVRMTAEKMRLLAEQFREVVPKSELNVRYEIETIGVEDDKQLIMWEQRLQRDPTSFLRLGDQYWGLYQRKHVDEYLDQAIRCYAKSQELLVSDDATRRLAMVYYEREDYEKWEQTLLSFLESDFPDQGLTRASISVLLANGLMDLQRWRDAKPHAVAAANTYSAWGMQCASRATEGLAEWQESEKWIREMSSNYPSDSGLHWYLWCRRTGRGDTAAARALAEPFFQATARSVSPGQLYDQGTYRILKEDLQFAKLAFSNLFSTQRRPEHALLVFQLTRELEGRAAALELATEMEALFPDPESRTDVAQEAVKILEVLKLEAAPLEKLQERVDAVLELPDYIHCLCLYVLGKEMALAGHEEAAVKTFRRAIMYFTSDEAISTLVGAELAKRFGTAREDDDSWDNEF